MLNPADIPSRGLSIKEAHVQRFWLCGPEFLLKEKEDWPKLKREDSPSAENTMTENQVNLVSTEEKTGLKKIIDRRRYGNLLKLLRVTCYVIRFIEKLRAKVAKSVVCIRLK